MLRSMPLVLLRMSKFSKIIPRNIPFKSKMLVFGAGLTVFGLLANHNVKAMQDNQLIKVKAQLKETVKKLKQQFGQMTVYPEIKYNFRGNTYTIEFQIDQRKCNIFALITTFFTIYNSTSDGSFKISDLKSLAQGQILTFYVDFEEQDPKWKTPQKGKITITGLRTNERPTFRLIFQKTDCVTPKNIQALSRSYRQSIKPKQNQQESSSSTRSTGSGASNSNSGANKKSSSFFQTPSKAAENSQYKKLEQYGLTVFDPNDKKIDLDWNYLAGYQTQKRSIEETILLALTYPQIYDQITEYTRVKNQPNRPKAILFEGPPGTGKTTSAKIISQQVKIPLVYIPIEAIMSELYGKSEQRLSEMWEACKRMGKVIIFIDQIDALAGNRSSDMHEASRRVLSTLLRKIDSFESTTDVMLICATNRKQDLDPAMLSRIDLSIKFSLPDVQSRAAIFQRYAKHLSEQERKQLAQKTDGLSGRNISDICKHAERRWASKLIKKEVEGKIPTLDEYLRALESRRVTEQL